MSYTTSSPHLLLGHRRKDARVLPLHPAHAVPQEINAPLRRLHMLDRTELTDGRGEVQCLLHAFVFVCVAEEAGEVGHVVCTESPAL